MCESWSENDARRQSIRTGETPPDRAFDVVGYVPPELKITDAETAQAFLLRHLQSALRSRPDWERYVRKVDEHNTRQMQRNAQPIKDYATELAEANTETLFAEQGKTITKVFVNAAENTKGTKRTKGRPADIPSPS